MNRFRLKTWSCGEWRDVQLYRLYPKRKRGLPAAAARADRVRINQQNHARRRKRHIRRIIEANFQRGDWFLTLTYPYSVHLMDIGAYDKAEAERINSGFPQSVDDVKRDIQNYIRKLKYYFKKSGKNPNAVKYLYVIESGKPQQDGEKLPWIEHFHVHMLLSGVDADAACAIWERQQGHVNKKQLRPGSDGLAAISAYFAKEERNFSSRWAHSKNLIIPEAKNETLILTDSEAAEMIAELQSGNRSFFGAMFPGYFQPEAAQCITSDFSSAVYFNAWLRQSVNERTKNKCSIYQTAIAV